MHKANSMRSLGVKKITMPLEDFELFKSQLGYFARHKVNLANADNYAWEGIEIRRK